LLKPILKAENTESILIRVPPGQINAAIGHQAKNKKMLLTKFRKVKFEEDGKLRKRGFDVVVG